jgi:hypothetical protein
MKLKIWSDPDGLYLLKGGCPDVWKLYRLPKKWAFPLDCHSAVYLRLQILIATLAASLSITW